MEKRTHRVQTRLTDEEYHKLKVTAARTKMSIEALLRASLQNTRIMEAPPADYANLLRALRAVGNNLNQAIKRFNETDVPDMPEFRKVRDQIQTVLGFVTDAFSPGARPGD